MEKKKGRSGLLFSRKSLLIFSLIVITIVGVLLALKKNEPVYNQSEQPWISPGRPAPNFTLPGLDGKMKSLADYKGKIVFLNIWATWCPTCKEEMPSMERLYQELKGNDFEILTVSIDASGAKVVASFLQKNKLSFLALLDPEGAVVKRLYGITGVPESFIINREGIIEKTVIGPIDWSTPEIIGFFRKLMQK